MAGKFRQLYVSNQNAVTGSTFTTTTPRRQYVLVVDGRFHGGSGTSNPLLRLNAFNTATHRNGWHFSQPTGDTFGEATTGTGAQIAQGGITWVGNLVGRLTKHANYWLYQGSVLAIAEGGGVHTFQRWSSQIPVTANITSLELIWNLSDALHRFTGQEAWWGSDD